MKLNLATVKTNENWKAFISGDYLAFKHLYEVHYPMLKKYAMDFTKDEVLSSECVQDLFIKLWNNRSTLNPDPASAKHYLIKAMRNVIINKLSRKSREQYLGHTEELLMAGHDCTVYEDTPPPFSPVTLHLINRLTNRQREAIYLFYTEDYTYKELAEHFEIQTTAAYKLVYRALDFLKAETQSIKKEES